MDSKSGDENRYSKQVQFPNIYFYQNKNPWEKEMCVRVFFEDKVLSLNGLLKTEYSPRLFLFSFCQQSENANNHSSLFVYLLPYLPK